MGWLRRHRNVLLGPQTHTLSETSQERGEMMKKKEFLRFLVCWAAAYAQSYAPFFFVCFVSSLVIFGTLIHFRRVALTLLLTSRRHKTESKSIAKDDDGEEKTHHSRFLSRFVKFVQERKIIFYEFLYTAQHFFLVPCLLKL